LNSRILTIAPRAGIANGCFLLAILAGFAPIAAHSGDKWQFTDITDEIGVGFQHLLQDSQIDTRDFMTGGLAAADINGNGLVDLYVPQGNTLPGKLLENVGNGTFTDVSEEWGLVVSSGPNNSAYATGAAFADLTGNGYPDLLLPGVRGFGLRLYLNDGEQFEEATVDWNLHLALQEHYSVAFADINGNGRLDVAGTHWTDSGPEPVHEGHLWLNQGDELVNVGESWGVSEFFEDEDWSFTPNFADLNGNGWPDLMIAADFETSEYFINEEGKGYRQVTDGEISDENGMGAAVADFNNNGHPDWFVTSIYHDFTGFPVGDSGNRMYLNDGEGKLIDQTDQTGVRDGDWGWGTCAADFNHSGYLDIFMVNGWNAPNSPFPPAPARMFVNRGDGTFDEKAVELGVGDTGQGRGIVCFDFDRDGDIDIFIQNNRGEGRVYRNNAAQLGGHWLGIRLQGNAPNTAGVGARVTVISGELEQTREMNIPNHYLSTSPAELLFGLGEEEAIDLVRIRWPDGHIQEHTDVSTNQWIVFEQELEDEIFRDRFQAGSPTGVRALPGDEFP